MHQLDRSPGSSPTRKRARMSPGSSSLNTDPFLSEPLHQTGGLNASVIPGFTKASAAAFDSDSWGSSQDAPAERDYSSWFGESTSHSSGFQPAKLLAGGPMAGFQTAKASTGFQTAAASALVPSSAALARAKEMTKDLWNDESNSMEEEFSFSLPTPSRTALQSIGNSPITPSKSFGTSTSFVTPALKKTQPKLFRPPTSIKYASAFATPTKSNTPFTPPSINTPQSAFQTARSQHSLSASIIATPGMSSFKTPLRHPSKSAHTPARFVTPFKPGMRPGEPGRQLLEKSLGSTGSTSKHRHLSPLLPPVPPAPPVPKVLSVFDLTVPPSRTLLSSSRLYPQQYTTAELEDMEIDVEGLRQVTPSNALYYSFYDTPWLEPLPSEAPFSMSPTSLLGADAALTHLKNRNCHLATKEWVDNHWGLILWKLAGMVGLEPERERKSDEKRWCWREVFSQLLYRYERELNRGVRPPLRLIVAQDVPASCPMVLCVSDVIWPQETTLAPPGQPVIPEIEVTDGWYRLRAQIDLPLARAVQKGALRAGRKIAVAKAQIWSERKEPAEILESSSAKLMIHGNGSHLAPWHAKLGFMKECPIANMRSLTHDGGIVPLMDIVVLEACPMFFVEFTEKDGKRTAQPPHSAAEEAKAVEKASRKRELEEGKLWDEFEKKRMRLLSYAERLDAKAGLKPRPDEAEMPEHIDDLYEELEEPAEAGAVIRRVTPNDAGWLAQHIRKRLEHDVEKIREEIQQELQSIHPPRITYSARILVVKDARYSRRPANRRAQLTVWDANKLRLTDGKPAGYFEPGQRFQVTNIHPTQHKSWMGHEHEAQIFLCTKSASRWKKLPPI